jgi:hypothetical protein
MSQQNKSQNRIYHEVKNTGFEFSFNKDLSTNSVSFFS